MLVGLGAILCLRALHPEARVVAVAKHPFQQEAARRCGAHEVVAPAPERELFERRGLSRVVSGAAPTLDIDVVGFEELREPPPRARVSLRVTLHDDRHSQLERTFTVDVPVGPDADAGPALARAMARALSTSIQQVADATVAELGAEQQAEAARQ